MGRKIGAIVVAGFCCMVLTAGTSLAAGDHPCKAEITKWCKDVKKGGGRIVKCLQEHDKDLSDACKAKLTTVEQKQADKKTMPKDTKEAVTPK